MNACRRVWGPTRLAMPASSGDATHDPPRGVAVESLVVSAEEDGSLAALADREVDGASSARRERHGHDLAALTQDREGAMPAPNNAMSRSVHQATYWQRSSSYASRGRCCVETGGTRGSLLGAVSG